MGRLDLHWVASHSSISNDDGRTKIYQDLALWVCVKSSYTINLSGLNIYSTSIQPAIFEVPAGTRLLTPFIIFFVRNITDGQPVTHGDFSRGPPRLYYSRLSWAISTRCCYPCTLPSLLAWGPHHLVRPLSVVYFSNGIHSGPNRQGKKYQNSV
jgi:hypothetical protein